MTVTPQGYGLTMEGHSQTGEATVSLAPPAGPRFDRATALTPLGAGRYRADLDPDFSMAGKLNGGYLLAIAARAAGDAPIAATAHYLRAPAAGPVELVAEALPGGRSTRPVRVRMVQDGSTTLEALVTCRTAPVAADPTAPVTAWSESAPVALPPEADCFRMPRRPPGAPFEVALMEVVEQRLDPACLDFATGRPTGAGQLRGWVRVPGQDPIDAFGLLLVADSLPPGVFDLGYLGWVPTFSLTVHLLGDAAPGPVRVRQQVRAVQEELVTQTCDIWDEAGRLVGHATQLATVRPPATSR